jgi:Strictosidine synthase
MKRFASFAVAAAAAVPCALGAASAFAQTPAAQPPAAQVPAVPARAVDDCSPAGNVSFICGGQYAAPAEDMDVIPGTRWVIAGSRTGAGGGGLRLIDGRDKSISTLYPLSADQDKWDKKTYSGCPGPVSGDARQKMITHGIAFGDGKGGVYRFYAVHHGDRESMEVFTIDARGKTPTATWIGCVIAPDIVGLNAVAGLPDGGFVATNYNPRGDTARDARTKMMAGENNGELWEWHPGKDWVKVPNSELSGANGVLLSKDRKTLYIAAWGSQKFVRLSRDGKKRDEVPVGFRVDNLRWAPDGKIFGGGQGDRNTWVVKIDPKTMAVTPIITAYPYSDAFSVGTVAIQLDKELWVGSTSFPHIAVFPVPK